MELTSFVVVVFFSFQRRKRGYPLGKQQEKLANSLRESAISIRENNTRTKIRNTIKILSRGLVVA
jgi:hypothetical protein